MKKVLFIFSGSRKVLNDFIAKGIAPDTQLYGMNHLGRDIDVSSKEFSDTFFGELFGNKIDFRLKHFLMYFSIGDADIVFGSSILYMAILKKLFRSKKKFILLNISLNRLLNQSKDKRPLFYRFLKSLLKEIDLIISLSNVQQDQLLAKHEIDKEKLKFIPLGVDVHFYKPVLENRKEYVLAAGRDNGRDYKTIIEVAKQLPQTQFQLVLSQRNLKGITEIPSNVTTFFDLSLNDLKKKYEEASVLLLTTHPDEFADGSDCSGQTVLLDSFASGIPVIATKKAYIADYGLDHQHLLLVEPYDVSGIIKAVEEAKKIGKDLTQKARKKVEREFSTEKMGDNLTSIFKSF